MPDPDDKSLVEHVTVNDGGRVVVIGTVIGNVLIDLRDGETELMHAARITLVNYASAVFVDIMRLYCVAGSDLARSVNSHRYQEFVDIADQHVNEIQTRLTRIYPNRLLPNSSPRPVDTKNRPLSHWPFGKYRVAAGTVWVVSSFNNRSFDSRYLGPISDVCIQSRLLPLLTV